MTRLVDRYQFAAKIALLSSAGLCPGYASAGASRRSGACVASRRWLGGGWLGREAPGITVTGFRSSIKSALDTKRRDIRISDGISSEDIGKFPAENITEAIQRIAGVQMSTSTGAAPRSASAAWARNMPAPRSTARPLPARTFSTASATTSSRPTWPAASR
jgi:hypothetical protein